MEWASFADGNWQRSLGGFPVHFLCFMIFFLLIFKGHFYKVVSYIALPVLWEKINIFNVFSRAYAPIEKICPLWTLLFSTSLPAEIRGNLTNRALNVQEVSLIFQGNGRLGPLGVHLWVSLRDVSGAEGSLVSRCINEKAGKATWLLVSSSRIPLNSNSDERLANRFGILQRLWDHPREACTIEPFRS